MSSDRTNIAPFSIFILPDFKSCLNLLRLRQCNQSSFVNSSPIKFGIFSSILEVSRTPKCISLVSSRQVSVCCTSFSHHHTCLKMRVSTECLLHFLSSRNCSLKFCPLERFLSLYKWTSFSDALIKDCCCSCRCCRCWFRGGLDFPASVEATVSRCMQEGLTFVSTFFKSCETVLVMFQW